MTERLPRMRLDLEYFPVQFQGEQVVLVRDHLGLVQEGKAIPVSIYRLMTLMAGVESMVELQAYLIRQSGGVLVRREEIASLIDRLDESFLLDTDRFQEARNRVVANFAAEPLRRPSHAGNAYPAGPEELGRRLDEILSSEDGDPVEVGTGDLRCLVSPHIDLGAGRRGYAKAYKGLLGAHPSRVILLGVGHRLADGLFCLTGKEFETPLGRVPSDKETVRRLRDEGGGIVSRDDFAHRSEHSIEFQVLFLQHLLPPGSFSIVPILCGSVQLETPEYRRSAYLSSVGPFAETLRDTLAEGGLLVAGVDLSHVGPKFGHQFPSSRMEPDASAHDRALLDALCAQDAERFWGESIRVKDGYNVCGFSALALLLEILPPCKSRLLHYEFWHEEPTQSAVSFAAVSFRASD